MASPSTGYAVFETAIGPCGLAWRGQQLVRVVLPEANARGTQTRLTTLFPDAQPLAPPTWVKRAVRALTASVGGKAVSLDQLPLALDGVPPFHRRVYEAARLIERGQTLSYVELAKRAGSERASRAVGQAMARNPFPLVVPCHRVLAAGGKVGGFTARDGTTLKARILASEGVRVDPIVAAKPTRSRFNAATRHLQKADPAMAKLIAKVGQCALDLRQLTTTFGALLEAIVYQQLTGKAAATIFGRVQALFDPTRFPTPAEIAAAPATTLRSAG